MWRCSVLLKSNLVNDVLRLEIGKEIVLQHLKIVDTIDVAFKEKRADDTTFPPCSPHRKFGTVQWLLAAPFWMIVRPML